jgi:hypothetical protein
MMLTQSSSGKRPQLALAPSTEERAVTLTRITRDQSAKSSQKPQRTLAQVHERDANQAI